MIFLKSFIKKRFTAFHFFYRYLGIRVFFVLGLSLLVGFLDGLGLTMFLPLLKIADGGSDVSGDGLGKLGMLVEWLNDLGIELTLFTVLCFMLLFFTLKGVASFYSTYYKVAVRQYFVREMRLKLLTHLSNYSYKHFVSSDAGRIQNALTGEVGRVAAAYTNYFGTLQSLVMVMVYMVFAFMVDWRFALLICAGGLLTDLVFRRIYTVTKKLSSNVTRLGNTYQRLMIQFVQNFKYLKATGTSGEYAKKMKHTVMDIESNNLRMSVLGTRISAIREPILVGVVCVVILVQVYALKGSLSSVLVSLLFFYRSLASLTAMQTNYNNFLSVSASLDNISTFESELKEGREADGISELSGFENGIQLKDIDFSYEDISVLRSIHLDIRKNTTVAFVGESGSGKTTLVNVITGLLPVSRGQVLVDDMPLSELKLQSYQKHIGYITQEAVIFNDTIFNNVTFWEEDTPENRDKFWRVLKQASIDGFVDQLPEKADSLLGHGGLNLSGGQRQRISIARELYKEADILILDEATSALDSQTEREIQENIELLQGQYTLLIVAHRLSTIKHADTIVLMENGKIKANGDFNQLMASNSQFKAMVELQTFENE